jgi:hypothetical protein
VEEEEDFDEEEFNLLMPMWTANKEKERNIGLLKEDQKEDLLEGQKIPFIT